MVQTHGGVLPGRKKERILPFVTRRMDPEGIVLKETSQAEKDKYRLVSLTCGI